MHTKDTGPRVYVYYLERSASAPCMHYCRETPSCGRPTGARELLNMRNRFEGARGFDDPRSFYLIFF